MPKQLYRELTQKQVNIYGLVLSSQGVPYFVTKSACGWEMWVEESLSNDAYNLITQYIAENKHLPEIETQDTPEYKNTYIGVWMALLLIGCHLRSNIDTQFNSIVREYGASAAAK